jgi:5-formyltetrahydrofolate cyclo-ligase
MSSAKKTARKLALHALREMDPKQRDRESVAVCNAVWNRVLVPAASRLAAHAIQTDNAAHVPSTVGGGGARSSAGRLAVLTYLPMSYELSLLPLMERVWAREAITHIEKTSALHSDVPQSVHIEAFVPHMVKAGQTPRTPAAAESVTAASGAADGTQSLVADASTSSTRSTGSAVGGKGGEMMFVQLRSMNDLQSCFTPRGKMNILELTDDAERELMAAVVNDATSLLGSHDGAELSHSSQHPSEAVEQRRGYLCFGTTAKLIPPPPHALVHHSLSSTVVDVPSIQRGSSQQHWSEVDEQATPLIDGGYLRTPRTTRTLSTVSSSFTAVESAAVVSPTTSHSGVTAQARQQPVPPPPPPASAHYPLRHTPPITTLVILTPAAMYDALGGRLGKGGGFYDLFLRRASALRGGNGSFHEVLVVGVGLSPQLLGGASAVTSAAATAPFTIISSPSTVQPLAQLNCGSDALDKVPPVGGGGAASDEFQVPVKVIHVVPSAEQKRLSASATALTNVPRVPLDPWDEFVDELMIAC